MSSELVTTILFNLLMLFSLFFAFIVVTSRNLLKSAVSLLAVLAFSAGFYFMLGAEFMAGIQLLVYVGGIVVLIVFAIMLTGSAGSVLSPPPRSRKLMGLMASVSFFFLTIWALKESEFAVVVNIMETTKLPGAKSIGLSLLNYSGEGYIIPFEVISILLLTALIGGVVIARKGES